MAPAGLLGEPEADVGEPLLDGARLPHPAHLLGGNPSPIRHGAGAEGLVPRPFARVTWAKPVYSIQRFPEGLRTGEGVGLPFPHHPGDREDLFLRSFVCRLSFPAQGCAFFETATWKNHPGILGQYGVRGLEANSGGGITDYLFRTSKQRWGLPTHRSSERCGRTPFIRSGVFRRVCEQKTPEGLLAQVGWGYIPPGKLAPGHAASAEGGGKLPTGHLASPVVAATILGRQYG